MPEVKKEQEQAPATPKDEGRGLNNYDVFGQGRRTGRKRSGSAGYPQDRGRGKRDLPLCDPRFLERLTQGRCEPAFVLDLYDKRKSSMREIRSKDNKIWKRCEQLTMRKYRDRSGLYLIEGENLLDEAIRNHVRIETVLVREDCQRRCRRRRRTRLSCWTPGCSISWRRRSPVRAFMAVVAKAEVRKEDFIGLPGSNFIVLRQAAGSGQYRDNPADGGRGGLSAGDR